MNASGTNHKPSRWAMVAVYGLLVAAPIAARGQAIVVVHATIDINRLPPIFRTYPDQLRENIRADIEVYALERCKKRFPYFQWRGQTEGDSPNAAATLELILTGGEVASGLITVRLVSGAKSPKGQFGIPYFPVAKLFESGRPLPDVAWSGDDAVRSEFAEGSKKAISNIFDANLQVWTNIAQAIPIAKTIVVQEDMERLVVPIKASQLRAARDSILHVSFVGHLPPQDMQRGFIEASPTVGVFAGKHAGMQQCQVVLFEFAPHSANSWHSLIPQVLTSNAVEIFMYHFVRDPSPNIRDAF